MMFVIARWNESCVGEGLASHIAKEIERWRCAQIVGFSAERLRAEAREAELNQAIVDLSREDILAGNFDLKVDAAY